LIAVGKSASSRTTKGFLDPISICIFFKRGDASAYKDFPTSTEPVKVIAGISGLVAI
jgi:hypothetical protein